MIFPAKFSLVFAASVIAAFGIGIPFMMSSGQAAEQTPITPVSSPVNALPNLASVPQTGLQTSYTLTEEEKAQEIEEGRKQFEEFTKTGNMKTPIYKVRKYFKSKGWPENPWTRYNYDVSEWCYYFKIGCPSWYHGMNNIYGWYNIRWENPPASFKGGWF